VYCYADCRGGYTTHVAARRHAGYVPRWWQVPTAWFKAQHKSRLARLRYKLASKFSWFTYRVQMRYLDFAPMRLIGLPHDGCDWRDASLADVLARLKRLKALGYRVPAGAIASITDEMQELETMEAQAA
jgi:hypothetical protein